MHLIPRTQNSPHWRPFGFFSLIAASLAILSPTSLAGATINFNEGEFSGWTSSQIYSNSPQQSVSVLGSGGNSGGYLRVITPDNAIRYTANFNPLFTYDPSPAGVINSIDFSLDFREFYTFGQGMAFGLAVSQGGTVFFTSGMNTGQSATANWVHFSASGVGGTGWFSEQNSNPDFTASGVPITFGIYTANQGGVGITVGYDNVSITLHTSVPSVPESGSLLSMVAMALIGLFGFRAYFHSR